jgi:hypothetical protein
MLIHLLSVVCSPESRIPFVIKQVETEEHQLIYKIPSGVSKHDPPCHPPSLKQMTKSGRGIVSSNTRKTENSSNEYLSPHEYADPGSRSDDAYQKGIKISVNFLK